MTSEAPATAPAATAKNQPHPLLDMALTVILPSIVLESLSKPERLGPAWALGVALLIPLGFGIWCFKNKRGLNFFSIFGLVAIIVTGGLGLLSLNAQWFAAKEALFPIFLGLAFPLSHWFGKPLVTDLLLNPQVINHRTLHKALDTNEKHSAFALLMRNASWGMAGTMFLSAVANYALAVRLIGGKEPGGEEYVKAIGKLNWMGTLVIGIPMVAITFVLLIWLLRRVSQITGLDRDDLLNQGTTVRRQV